MASYSSSTTSPERWAKIVEAEESGRYPDIMIDDGELNAVSKPELRAARIQSFLADVFKDDGDREWFGAASVPAEASEEKAASDGQPEGSKKKKISLTQQRANARQEKIDKGFVIARDERTKDDFSPTDWAKITGDISTRKSRGVYLEGGKLVATGRDGFCARDNMTKYLDVALGFCPDGLKRAPGGKFVIGRWR